VIYLSRVFFSLVARTLKERQANTSMSATSSDNADHHDDPSSYLPRVEPKLVNDPRAVKYLRKLWALENQKKDNTDKQKQLIDQAKKQRVPPAVLKRALQSIKKNDKNKNYEDYEIAIETYAIVNKMKSLEEQQLEESSASRSRSVSRPRDSHDDQVFGDDGEEAGDHRAPEDVDEDRQSHDDDDDDDDDEGDNEGGPPVRSSSTEGTTQAGGLVQQDRSERITPPSTSGNQTRGRSTGRGGAMRGGMRGGGRGNASRARTRPY
jgi:hypothetical protein